MLRLYDVDGSYRSVAAGIVTHDMRTIPETDIERLHNGFIYRWMCEHFSFIAIHFLSKVFIIFLA